MAEIIFPNLGISFGDISTGFTIFGFNIAYYGVLIAVGMVLAVVLAMARAKKTNQDPDDYIDLGIAAIVVGVICARLYYVLFRLDYYLAYPAEIINIRGGGLAIYGGIIGGIAAGFIVARVKKINFLRVLDTVAPGIALAQGIGRWGNFINREAFGKFTDGLFAMQIPYNDASGVINLYKDLPEMQEIINNTVTIDGIQYIQVHPTFLYESLWCILLFVLIMIFRKYQRYNGEVILWYLGGYALERAFVEGLRIDQLRIAGTDLAVSQLLSIAIAAAAILLLIINRVRLKTGSFKPGFTMVLPAGAPGTKEHTEARKKARKEKKGNQWETETVVPAEEEEDAEATETADAETTAGEPTEVEEPAEAEPTEVLEAEETNALPEEAVESAEASEASETAEPECEAEKTEE